MDLVISVKRTNEREVGDKVGWSVEMYGWNYKLFAEFTIEAPESFAQPPTPDDLELIIEGDKAAEKAIIAAQEADAMIYPNRKLISGYNPQIGVIARF